MVGCREHCYDAFCNDAAYLASYGGNYAANYVVLSVQCSIEGLLLRIFVCACM